jgi:hypothetical protein
MPLFAWSNWRRPTGRDALSRWLAPNPAKTDDAVLLADDPDSLDDDVFGHSDYASALGSAIEAAPNGVTFGLFGPWGIGKSSVLRALENRLAPETPVVIFDAWRYRDDAFRREFLRDVAAQLLERHALKGFNLDRDLRDLDVDTARPREVFAFTWRRIVQFGLFCALLWVAFLAADERILDTTASRVSVVAIVGLLTLAVGRIDRLLEIRTETESQKRLEDADRFSRRFREILGGVRTRRLVLAIDNVDRLDAAAAVDLLSSVKTYLEPAVRHPRRGLRHALLRRNAPAPRVAFVVAVDDRAVRAYIRDSAPSGMNPGDYADEFLRKFFAVRLAVRPLLDDDVRSFIEERVRPLADRWVPGEDGPQRAESIERETSELTELILAGVRANPRRVKHFINSMEMALRLVQARRDAGQIEGARPGLALLGQLVFIEEEFADLFDHLVRDEQILDEMHLAAQLGELPNAWRGTETDWKRMLPVLLSTYSVDRSGTRTYLRLKIGATERNLPDREAVLTALRTGNLAAAEARLDPAHVRDTEDSADRRLAERAELARPWADQLESLIAAELRSGRQDAAINLLRAGIEIDVFAFHRAAIARAIARAVSDLAVRRGLWRLPPDRLFAFGEDLPDAARTQLVDALAESFARNHEMHTDRREQIANELATTSTPISRDKVEAIRSAVEQQPRASEFDYAPLVARYPELLTQAAIAAAVAALAAATREGDDDPQGQPPAALHRLLRGSAGRVIRTAAATGQLPLDGEVVESLADALTAARSSAFADELLTLIERAVRSSETATGAGLDRLASALPTQFLRSSGAGIALLAAAAVVNRQPAHESTKRLLQEIEAQASLLAPTVARVDERLYGPVRAALLRGLPRNTSRFSRGAVATARSLLDPAALIADLDPDVLVQACRRWTDEGSHMDLVASALDEQGITSANATSGRIAFQALEQLTPETGTDPDLYRATAVFRVDRQTLDGSSTATIASCEVGLTAHLRRDSHGVVHAEIGNVTFM